MTQQITKVKFKNNQTVIELRDLEVAENTSETHSVISIQPRHKDFTDSFAELLPHICEYFDYPVKWVKQLEIGSISIKHDATEGLGINFSLVKKYEGLKGVSSVTTPFISECLDSKKFNEISQELLLGVNKVLKEADNFVEGKRAQGELDLSPTKKKKAA